DNGSSVGQSYQNGCDDKEFIRIVTKTGCDCNDMDNANDEIKVYERGRDEKYKDMRRKVIANKKGNERAYAVKTKGQNDHGCNNARERLTRLRESGILQASIPGSYYQLRRSGKYHDWSRLDVQKLGKLDIP
ncbi:19511_t:CDS:2, partial [Gigaspora rosea]